ncbi:MAG: TlpA disulfide reductase family protein [Chloroflexaceae bacterium]
MRPIPLFALTLLIAATLVAGCGARPGDTPPGVSLGQPLPEASFTTGSGERVSVADLRGNPAVINFWATWCAPCREEIPVLQAAYAAHGQNGVAFLAVTDELPITVRPFMEQINMTLPVWYDPGGRAGQRYAIQSIPTTFFLDADGRLVARHTGALTRRQLEAYLQQLTSGREDRPEPPAGDPPLPTRIPAPGGAETVGWQRAGQAAAW